MTTVLEPTAQRVVRVWFGNHTIAEIKAEPRLADRVREGVAAPVSEPQSHQSAGRPVAGHVEMIPTRGRLALGYMRRYPLMSADDLGRWQQLMADTAKAHGFVLGTVHVEELPTELQAFEALLTSIRDVAVAVVIVPSPFHGGDRDEPGTRRHRLWLETGSRWCSPTP